MAGGGTPDVPASPTPRRKGEREAEILEAALELGCSPGYDRLTMDAVAAQAKASKATLYRRWSDQPPLVVDAILQSKEALQAPAPTPAAWGRPDRPAVTPGSPTSRPATVPA